MDELLNMLRQTGLPFAYDHYAEGESPEPPFLVYLLPESHHFPADGKVYHRVTAVHLELYTDRKDPDQERTIEREDRVWAAERSRIWIYGPQRSR